MEELTVGQVEAVHAEIIRRDGGDPRIISEANVHQLVFQANLILSRIERSAFVFWFLCVYPAFREGNLRTACTVAGQVLAPGGSRITGTRDDVRALAEAIILFTADIDEVEAWFRLHVSKMSEA